MPVASIPQWLQECVQKARVPHTFGLIGASCWRIVYDYRQQFLDQFEIAEVGYASPERIKLVNGTVIAFQALAEPSRIYGYTLDWYGIDPTDVVSSEAREVLDARTRPKVKAVSAPEPTPA